MGKFNWWRREGTRKRLQQKDALKGRSLLLQQIEHGDFDPSSFYKQALKELDYCKTHQDKLRKTWPAGESSLKYKLEEIERAYIKRYNKLMEDYHAEELRLIAKLRESLIREFGMDLWLEVLEQDSNQTVLDLYKNYKAKVNEKLQQRKTSKVVQEMELEEVGNLPFQVAN